jgi:DNA repair exonuclease SbcCD nuclease subunit
MSEDTTTLLCTGDIHMGRRPGALPEPHQSSASANQTWRDLVEFALQRSPETLLLTGDIIDRENKYYEALGPLEEGIRRLGKAGIKVVAVSGNHDFDVLPRLVGNLEESTFELLGEGGEWERTTVEREGEPLLHIDGWSYPARRPQQNPIDDYDLEPRNDAPVLGLLHAQLGDLSSPYAHADLPDLRATHLDAWCLGHEHGPEPYESPSQPTVLYQGCPQGLDPTETGKHGPWTLEISRSGGVELEQHGLATVRFERLSIDASGLEDMSDVEASVLETITRELERCLTENIALEALSVRLEIEGRTEAHGALRDEAREIAESLTPEREGARALIEAVDVETSPDFDLEELSRGDDPMGVLADRLRSWSDDETDPQEMPLVREALERMQRLAKSKPYRILRTVDDHEAPTLDDARRMLLRQGYALLEQMEKDKEEA